VLDPSYNPGGGSPFDGATINAGYVNANDSVLVVGTFAAPGADSDIAQIGVAADGSLDTSFDGDGLAVDGFTGPSPTMRLRSRPRAMARRSSPARRPSPTAKRVWLCRAISPTARSIRPLAPADARRFPSAGTPLKHTAWR